MPLRKGQAYYPPALIETDRPQTCDGADRRRITETIRAACSFSFGDLCRRSRLRSRPHLGRRLGGQLMPHRRQAGDDDPRGKQQVATSLTL